MRILITGFEPNDDGFNASKILIESLRDYPHEKLVDITNLLAYEVMPPSSIKLKGTVLRAIKEHNAECCVFTGQAPGRNKITFERFATNLKDFGSLDGENNQPRGELIEYDGPAAYWSSLPNQEALINSQTSHCVAGLHLENLAL